MSYGFKIIKNSAAIISGNFLNKIISIILLFYLTNYLGPDQFGHYSFVVAYVTFFGIFTDLGLNILMTREISINSIDPHLGFGHAIIIRFLLTVVTTAAAIVSLYALDYPMEIIKLTVAYSLSLFISFRGLFFRNVFEIPFQVNLKMNYPATVNFLNELLTLGAIVWLITNKVSLWSIVFMISVINVPGFIAIAYYSTRMIRPKFKADFEVWKGILRDSLPLGTAVILEGIFVFIPVFMLSKMATDAQLGFYSLSFRLVSSIWIIPVAVMVSLQPKMSRDAVGNALFESFFLSFKAILLIGIPIALVTAFFSGTIISVFTGGRYAEAVPVLSVMIWGTLFYFVNSVFFYTFTAARHQKIITLVWSVIILLCIVSCYLLIPKYREMGAAISYVVSIGGGLVVYFVLAYRVLKINMVVIMIKFFTLRLWPKRL